MPVTAVTFDDLNPNAIGIDGTDALDELDDRYNALKTGVNGSVGALFQYRASATSGLNFAYADGRVRNASGAINQVTGGTIAVTNGTTNYVEVNSSGTVSVNTTGFGTDKKPLYTVVASGGNITTVTDCRTDFDFTSTAGSGSGDMNRCFHPDTEVLTRAGWKPVADVDYSDAVATLNPDTLELEYQNPRHLFAYDYDGVLVGRETKQLKYLVTPNHRVFVGRWYGGQRGRTFSPYRWEEASDTVGKIRSFPIVAHWTGEHLEKAPFDINPDTFIRFMGWFLSEGCVCGTKIYITQTKPEHTEEITEIMSEIAVKLGRCLTRGKTNFQISHAGLAEYLRHFGKAHEKFVPDGIKRLHPSKIQLFLDAYAKGDGYKTSILTSSPRMADDLQELVLKSGGWASIVCKGIRGFGVRPTYSINVNFVNLQGSTTPAADFEVPYKGKVYCLEVPNHLLYTRLDGRCVFLGNSTYDPDINGIIDISQGGTNADTAAGARTNLGLGTMATQAASAVNITGGTVVGITDLTVADGGTGASTAAGARTNLGLGSIATQNANNVAITGGSISGLASDLAVSDGGTGASTAANARTNLGLVIGTDVAAASHSHAAGDITSGTMATARLGSGTADNTKFLRGDQTWAVPVITPGAAVTLTPSGSNIVFDPDNGNLFDVEVDADLNIAPDTGGYDGQAVLIRVASVGDNDLTFTGNTNPVPGLGSYVSLTDGKIYDLWMIRNDNLGSGQWVVYAPERIN